MKAPRILGRTLTASLLAGLAAPGVAQECRLSVTASDTVLMPGETVSVDVRAHFPTDAYAFAAAELDVEADIPSWIFASDGAIAGANVFGIAVGQDHRPFEGVFADPSNPIRVWTGVFEPDSYDPRLVELRATPSSFWYYPSELTSSAVECAADPGRDWVLINPVQFGNALVAPGEGTVLEFGGGGLDVLIANTGGDRILVGMLVPAVQKVRVGPWDSPEGFTIEVGLERTGGSDDMPTETISMNYGRADSGFGITTGWPQSTEIEYVLMRKGAVVGRFDADGGAAPFRVERLPDVHSTRVERVGLARPRSAAESWAPAVVGVFEYDAPVDVLLGNGKHVEADAVHVRARCTNNLKQIGLAVHNVYELRGQQITYVGLE